MRRRAVLTALLGLTVAALPAQAGAQEVCRFQDPRITESSGLVLSSSTDRVLFTHNDSGDDARSGSGRRARPRPAPWGQLATTGGDVARDGSRVVVRTYSDAYEWDVPDGDLLRALTLTAPRTRTALPPTAQGEAVGYASDSRTLWVSSEGTGAPVHRLG